MCTVLKLHTDQTFLFNFINQNGFWYIGRFYFTLKLKYKMLKCRYNLMMSSVDVITMLMFVECSQKIKTKWIQNMKLNDIILKQPQL